MITPVEGRPLPPGTVASQEKPNAERSRSSSRSSEYSASDVNKKPRKRTIGFADEHNAALATYMWYKLDEDAHRSMHMGHYAEEPKSKGCPGKVKVIVVVTVLIVLGVLLFTLGRDK
jgi:hypothetical protein